MITHSYLISSILVYECLTYFSIVVFQVTLSQDTRDRRQLESGDTEVTDDGEIPSTSSAYTGSQQPSKKKAKKGAASSSGSVLEVLREHLAAVREEQEETTRELRDLCHDDSNNPRVTWGAWLASACHEIPTEHFRQWQKESFDLAMRYLPPTLVPPPLVMPPPRSHFQRQRQEQQPLQPTQPLHQRQTLAPMVSHHQQHQQGYGSGYQVCIL